jgi:lactate dehydrogenase-like 2-hydroxyacid dehydrogenase
MAKRELVVTTHDLPHWTGPEVAQEFDLRMLDLDSPDCRQARVLITPGPAKVGADVMDGLPALQYIAAIGSGIEGIDREHAARRGITISNAALITADDVADHTVSITLANYSRILDFDRIVKTGQWSAPPPFRRSLREIGVGIVGLGAIGLAVAKRLAAFDCEIRWTGPRFKTAPYPYVADLGELADWSGILVIAARADSTNVAMINRPIIDRLGPEGLLVNVSRGSIIDEDALIAALKDRRLGGAALDVFQTEPTSAERWRDVPGTILTPHIGGFATGVLYNSQKLIRSNLHAFFEGRELTGLVPPRL